MQRNRRKFGQQTGVAGVVLAGVVSVAAWLVGSGQPDSSSVGTAALSAQRRATGQPQLVSIKPLSSYDGAMCEWLPAAFSPAAAMPHPAADETMPRNEQIDRAP